MTPPTEESSAHLSRGRRGRNEISTQRSPDPSSMESPETSDITFVINLEFPGSDQPRQRYRVSPAMRVRRLYYLIASEILHCEDRHNRIFVNGECLSHLGAVTDRHFPGVPSQLTVYLYRDCTAYVYRIGDTDTVDEQMDGESSPDPQRRVSTRVRGRSTAQTVTTQARPVRDRWFYAPVEGPSLLITQGPATITEPNNEAAGVRPLLVAQGSSDIFDEESSGDSNPPISKRSRLSEETKHYRPNDETSDVLIQVSRRERAILLKEFQRNQRLARKTYKSTIRALWDAELADDKAHGLGTTGEEIDSEVEAEAYEDYLFTKMMRYDNDTPDCARELRGS
jgi:hypothetical protein